MKTEFEIVIKDEDGKIISVERVQNDLQLDFGTDRIVEVNFSRWQRFKFWFKTRILRRGPYYLAFDFVGLDTNAND